ncbi:HD domain-containing protein [Guptibacillus spartinae]|uniref:HD domain-containing protein n=1 Tax=Guptibacillus spartinae TaxID=3025679 RepID=UPI00235F7FC6|nr:HD domain-containing protein [Pseudalkalibacillus spartinae]
MLSSRTKHLEHTLAVLGFNRLGLKAFDLVIDEMCAEKGFTRHNGTHYYYHLIDVAQKLINEGIDDEEIIAAALLHDLVEDVDKYTIHWVESEFNSNVAHMVGLLTKDPDIDYKRDKEALSLYLNLIFENVGASLIKTADRIHNFGTLKDASVEKKKRYAMETEMYFFPFFKKCRKRYVRYASFWFQAKTEIEPHLREIKERYEQEEKLLKQIDTLEKQIKDILNGDYE